MKQVKARKGVMKRKRKEKKTNVKLVMKSRGIEQGKLAMQETKQMDGWMDGKVDRKSLFCWPPVEWERDGNNEEEEEEEEQQQYPKRG